VGPFQSANQAQELVHKFEIQYLFDQKLFKSQRQMHILGQHISALLRTKHSYFFQT